MDLHQIETYLRRMMAGMKGWVASQGSKVRYSIKMHRIALCFMLAVHSFCVQSRTICSYITPIGEIIAARLNIRGCLILTKC